MAGATPAIFSALSEKISQNLGLVARTGIQLANPKCHAAFFPVTPQKRCDKGLQQNRHCSDLFRKPIGILASQ